jgi:hypothetical protein
MITLTNETTFGWSTELLQNSLSQNDHTNQMITLSVITLSLPNVFEEITSSGLCTSEDIKPGILKLFCIATLSKVFQNFRDP